VQSRAILPGLQLESLGKVSAFWGIDMSLCQSSVTVDLQQFCRPRPVYQAASSPSFRQTEGVAGAGGGSACTAGPHLYIF